MVKNSKMKNLVRYEIKICLVVLILIIIAGCITWRSFFRTPPADQIRRDYLVEDLVRHSAIRPERLAQLSPVELEIVARLDLNGLIALERAPSATIRVYEELKNFDLFYAVVEEYGPQHVIPALDYFYEEGNVSLWLEDQVAQLFTSWFGEPLPSDSLTARQKRLLAILNEIHEQRHNFLARFIYLPDGAARNYVATTTSTLVNFFTGGLSQLNVALVTRGVQGVTTAELIDAGIDLAVLIPFAMYLTRSSGAGAKVLSAGQSAVYAGETVAGGASGMLLQSGRAARMASMSRSIWNMIPVRTLFKLKYVKWYLLGLVVMKPQLINHAASLVGQAVGIQPLAMKFGFWFLIIFPLLNLLTPLFWFGRFIWRRLHPTSRLTGSAGE
ncbi:hypothetical protein L0128_14405 [candidate division KSB1 bacterium]|nr:hypothetical protein [candidate division KSB1 bacterium]